MNGASQTGILIALGVVVAGGIFGAVMAPESITPIIGFATLIATSLLTLLAQLHSSRRIDEKIDKVDRNTDATHTLVNSQTSAQLRANAIMARRIAALTNDPNDHALATAAEEDYHEHESKQSMVDKGFGVATSQTLSRKSLPQPLPSAALPASPAPVAAPVAAPVTPPVEDPDIEKMTIEGHEMAKIEITKEKAK